MRVQCGHHHSHLLPWRKAPWLLSPQPSAKIVTAFLCPILPDVLHPYPPPSPAYLLQGCAHPLLADGLWKEAPRPPPACNISFPKAGGHSNSACTTRSITTPRSHHPQLSQPQPNALYSFQAPGQISMSFWPSPSLSPIPELTGDPVSKAEHHLPALSPHQSCFGQITERASWKFSQLPPLPTYGLFPTQQTAWSFKT